MSVPEVRRHELYTGLTDVLGPDLTDRLMAYLPTSPGSELATREDLRATRDDLSEEIGGVRREVAQVRSEVTELRADFRGLRGEFGSFRSETLVAINTQSHRIDKLQHTLVVGLTSIVVALIGVIGAIALA